MQAMAGTMSYCCQAFIGGVGSDSSSSAAIAEFSTNLGLDSKRILTAGGSSVLSREDDTWRPPTTTMLSSAASASSASCFFPGRRVGCAGKSCTVKTASRNGDSCHRFRSSFEGVRIWRHHSSSPSTSHGDHHAAGKHRGEEMKAKKTTRRKKKQGTKRGVVSVRAVGGRGEGLSVSLEEERSTVMTRRLEDDSDDGGDFGIYLPNDDSNERCATDAHPSLFMAMGLSANVGSVAVRRPTGDVDELAMAVVSDSPSSINLPMNLNLNLHDHRLFGRSILGVQLNEDILDNAPEAAASTASANRCRRSSTSESRGTSATTDVSTSIAHHREGQELEVGDHGGRRPEANVLVELNTWTPKPQRQQQQQQQQQQQVEDGEEQKRGREHGGRTESSKTKGDVMRLGIRDTSLISTVQHRLWVGGTMIALADVAVQCMGHIHDLSSLSTAGLGIGTGYVIADLLSGVYHWGIDNYGDVNTPLFGPQIDAFQGHHQRPRTISRRHFANNTHAICKPALAFLLPFLRTPSFSSSFEWTNVFDPLSPSLSGSSEPGLDGYGGSFLMNVVDQMHGQLAMADSAEMAAAAGYGFILTSVLFIVLSQQFHSWSHSNKNELPRGVRLLQDLGILISPREHSIHHRPPYEGRYCIVSGICNPYLDDNKIFYRLESFIHRTWGVAPRNWFATQTAWLEQRTEAGKVVTSESEDEEE